MSFAWTTEVYLKGLKTVTRRFWTDEYAEKWWRGVQKDNGIFMGTDKSPRFKGKPIGEALCVKKPYKQKLSLMTDEDERKEGGLWGSARAYVEMMLSQNKGDNPYVIEFKKI